MKKRVLRLVVRAIILCIIVALFATVTALSNESDLQPVAQGEGRTFESGDEFSMTVPLDTQPMTYRALIDLPAGEYSAKSVMLGNRKSGVTSINFEIEADGNPALEFVTEDADEPIRISFDYDLRGKGWTDVAITRALTDGVSEFSCYINGELIGTQTSEQDLTLDMLTMQDMYRFMLGRDWYSSNNYFKGRMANLSVYNKPLAEDEIAALYTSGVDLSDPALMAYYDLNDSANQTGARINDSTDGNHDFEPLYHEAVHGFDYAYSMAVVGDTQHITYNDAHKGTNYLSYIYDWLVENKDEKNIQLVIGVGDVTHRDGKDDVNDGLDRTDVEWDIALKEHNKLLEAGLPYSIAVGNHDTTSKLDEYFEGNDNFKYEDIEYMYYEGTSLGNYCTKFTAPDGTSYIVFVLDYGANDKKLVWAGDIIEKNPESKIIITTHAYMNKDGTTYGGADGTSIPRPSNINKPDHELIDRNNGDDMWHELASRYENIILVISGHIETSDVIYRKDYGDHGNTVYQLLVDYQAMDPKFNYNTGMVAMLYFSEGGDVINVEYISTYKSLETQKDDPDAADVVFRPAVNSFAMEYPIERGESVETVYGTISPTYVDKELYPVALFKSDKTFIGGFYNLNHAMESIVSVYNSQDDDYIIYVRAPFVDPRHTYYTNSAKFNGHVTIDLNGHIYEEPNRNYSLFFEFSDDNINDPSVLIKNGTMVRSGSNIGFVRLIYDEEFSTDVNCNITFENVTFRGENDQKDTSIAFCVGEVGYGTATGKVKVCAQFNDCTFDFANSTAKVVMIPMVHYYYKDSDHIVFNTTVTGGTAVANVGTHFTSRFSSGNTGDNADTLKFARNDEGEYLKVVVPTGATAPASTYKAISTDGKECAFYKSASDETYDTYSMGATIATKYGVITADYEDSEDYPVVVFQGTISDNMKLFGAYSSFDEATESIAAAYSSGKNPYYGKSYVFYIREDITVTTSTDLGTSKNSTVIVDLNGHTLTHTNKYLFYLTRNTKTADPTVVAQYVNLNFVNGTIYNASAGATLSLNYGNVLAVPHTESFAVSYTFDNITYKTTSANRYGIFLNSESGASKLDATSPMRIEVTATFNNCVLDFRGATAKNFIMLDMGDDSTTEYPDYDRTIYNITINGGKIVTDQSLTGAKFMYADGNKNGRADKVTFGKYNGSYTTFECLGEVTVDLGQVSTVEGYKAIVGAKNQNGISALLPAEIKIISASLILSSDINVSYAVVMPDTYTNPYMVFEFCGVTYTVENYVVNNGQYSFRFTGVAPHMLGENISATVYAENNGAEVSHEVASFSIKLYCEELLSGATDAKLITLLSDLLAYGARSQEYTDYKATELVTDGVEGYAPSAFTELTTTDKAVSGTADARVVWNGIGLRYENAMAINFEFNAAENLVLKIQINGRVTTYNISELEKSGEYYRVCFRGIRATEYGDLVTATFYDGEMAVGQSVTYSINSYVYSVQNSSDTPLAELVKATYNYGAAALAYSEGKEV